MRVGLMDELNRAKGEPAAFGSLRFPGTRAMPAKWAAVSSETQTDALLGLLRQTWRLPPPRVLISVTGAASGSMDALSKKEQV